MANNTLLNPVFTGEGRVFINPAGFGGGTKFTYHSNMKIDGLDRSLGDYEPVYLPDPKQYDAFIEVGAIKGADSRVTSTLSGKLPIDTYSALELLANRGCAFNLQVHYGRCSKPDDFATFESAIIIKDARLTSYNLSTLVASNPGERALIDESAGLNAKSAYRVFNQRFLVVDPSSTGRVLRVAYGDVSGCSESCSAYRDGNQVWIALVDATTNDFSVTLDSGLTWTQFPTGAVVNHTATYGDAVLVAAGSYIFWTVNDSSHTCYFYAADLATVVGLTTPTAYQLTLTTTFIPRDVAVTDSYVYIVGSDATGAAGGEVWRIDKDTLEIELVFSLSDGIWSVHGLDDDNVIIGTSLGEIYQSEVSGFFSLLGAVGGASDPVKHVHMHDETHWVATVETDVWATMDGGTNWDRTFTIVVTGTMENAYITWYDNLVGYMIYGNYLYRTIDSGTTWKRIYTGLTADESLNIVINPNDPNMFMAAYAMSATDSQVIKAFV